MTANRFMPRWAGAALGTRTAFSNVRAGSLQAWNLLIDFGSSFTLVAFRLLVR